LFSLLILFILNNGSWYLIINKKFKIVSKMASIKKITQNILLVSLITSTASSFSHQSYYCHKSERESSLLPVAGVTASLFAAASALGYACYCKGISNKKSLKDLDPSKKDFWGNPELDFKSPPGTGWLTSAARISHFIHNASAVTAILTGIAALAFPPLIIVALGSSVVVCYSYKAGMLCSDEQNALLVEAARSHKAEFKEYAQESIIQIKNEIEAAIASNCYAQATITSIYFLQTVSYQHDPVKKLKHAANQHILWFYTIARKAGISFDRSYEEIKFNLE
jgi:hypothetical protein